MKSWSDIGFEIEITGDGSPSLRLLQSMSPEKQKGESMHHSGGASSETELIYGQAVSRVMRETHQPSFLIVGLGLGYIEMFIARQALLAGLNSSDIKKITTFESVFELSEFFFNWLWGDVTNLSTEVASTYDAVLASVVKDSGISGEAVKFFLRNHFVKITDIQGSLTADICLAHKYQGILYDAFSSKTTPFLWEEEFLNRFLQLAADNYCVLSTYACKGSLKRALREQGFSVEVRPGFQGKRNSTLGVKN